MAHERDRQIPPPQAPGPTPGSAEGDRETVEADLREKQRKGEL